jgi:1,4-alpha-glucan branching enzyme
MTSVGKDGTVDFWFYRRGVQQVRVVGDFAGWAGGSMDMTAEGNGWWRLSAKLGSGEYRFRYAADGEWYADYASNGIEPGESGVSSVLVVPGRKAAAAGIDQAKMVA